MSYCESINESVIAAKVAFGRTRAGRLLVIVFEKKAQGFARIITGWDMGVAERRYYQRHRKG
jgi:hypothetical protein